MANQKMNVYYTKCDGFYVCVKNGKISAYEGKALCPPSVVKWLENNKPIELDEFYHDAIAYGYCK